MRIASSILLFCLVIGFMQTACKMEPTGNAMPYQNIKGDTGWTKYNITYLDTLKRDFSKQFVNLMEEIELETSTFKDDSVISKFNRSKSKFVLPEKALHFSKNIEKSKEIHKITNGFFDPTVMPLVNYWGFGYDGKKQITKVDSQQIKMLLNYVGLEKITQSNLENRKTFNKTFPESQLDFSAIAKGYAVDCFGKLLEEQGVSNYMVEIGGEVVAKGVNGKGKIWTIGINTPKEGSSTNSLEEIIQLKDKALATSGNYRNYYEVDGKKYSHTIHPKTGFPERNQLLSASIVTKDCMTADALATGCMTMGLEAAKKMVDSLPDVEALFIYTGANETMEVFYTKGIANSLLIRNNN